jgi:uncharacterized membrane protein YeaQ/YmgE (transglycosylase-associated protein family)
MHWIWFILAGALGRLIHPGRDPMGWLLTIAIGIVSMIIAAAMICSVYRHPSFGPMGLGVHHS